eukprot:TRINITY_DN13122_c4_g1_i1.p2 TRINITY_DN13122_c4_g1~~TRINITY_DN13122_c4_g1_i1.p2  ORF type:complete len:287 (+),score=81.93 TRINITY_DN13122_c4_g1_i1:97-957(+)
MSEPADDGLAVDAAPLAADAAPLAVDAAPPACAEQTDGEPPAESAASAACSPADELPADAGTGGAALEPQLQPARGDALLSAVAAGDGAALRAALADDANVTRIDDTDGAGWAPLHIAARAGSVECTLALLDAGADCDVTGPDSVTPLFCACAAGEPGTARALLEAGAYAGCVDDRGNTCSHAAAEAGSAGCLAELCRFGALPTRSNEDGLSPADVASGPAHDVVREMCGAVACGPTVSACEADALALLVHRNGGLPRACVQTIAAALSSYGPAADHAVRAARCAG